MIHESCFQSVRLTDFPEWSHINSHLKPDHGSRSQWLFRGQHKVEWGFRHSLERAVYAAAIETRDLPDPSRPEPERREILEGLYRTVPFRGLGPQKLSLAMIEAALIRQFKRRSHHFLTHLPDDKDFPEWLALMQHFGAPTRLLDWTYSFYVALFFAVERSEKENAVWALNATWLNDEVRRIFAEGPGEPKAFTEDLNCRRPEHFKELFQPAFPVGRPPTDHFPKSRSAFVCAMNPYRLNERLVIQQASILVAGDINRSFEENLEAMLPASGTKPLVKFVIDYEPHRRREAIERLYRMNITRATLFPGLQGFAESLETHLSIPSTLAQDPAEFETQLPS